MRHGIANLQLAIARRYCLRYLLAMAIEAIIFVRKSNSKEKEINGGVETAKGFVIFMILLALALSFGDYQQKKIEGIDPNSGSHYTRETKSVAADPYLMGHGQRARTDSLVDAFQRDGCGVMLVGDATIVYRGGNESMLVVDTSKIVSMASVTYMIGDKVAVMDISRFEGNDPYLNISRELRGKWQITAKQNIKRAADSTIFIQS